MNTEHKTIAEMSNKEATTRLMAHPIVQETRWLLDGVRKASPDAFLVLEPDPMCAPLSAEEEAELGAWLWQYAKSSVMSGRVFENDTVPPAPRGEAPMSEFPVAKESTVQPSKPWRPGADVVEEMIVRATPVLTPLFGWQARRMFTDVDFGDMDENAEWPPVVGEVSRSAKGAIIRVTADCSTSA